MTTMTYTAPIAAIPALNIRKIVVDAVTPVARFCAVFFGMTAAKDSAFRGLDLNGNAMWAATPKH